MKLPKYVYARANSYYYQRHYPTAVQSVAPTKKFVMPLDAKVGASERQVALAAIKAGEAFDLDVARLKNSSWDGAMEAGADALSDKVMKSYNLDDGDLAKGSGVRDIIETIAIGTFQDLNGREPNKKELKEMMASWIDKITRTGAQEMLPGSGEVDQRVRKRIEKRMVSKPSRAPSTLTQLWAPYCRYRGYEMDTSLKRYRTKLSDWENAMAYIGEHSLSDKNTAKEINRGIKDRVDDMIEKGTKPSSAVRAVSMPLAVFRWAVDEYDLDWRIKQPRVPAEKVSQKHSASRTDMIELARELVRWNDVQSVIGIAACHGIIPSELAQCDPSGLSNKVPYILIPPAKTRHRKRVTPIVWGIKPFKENIAAAIEYCAAKADPGAAFNKRLKEQVFGADTKNTLYSFRHGCRNLFVLSDASTPIMQAALGWAGGDQGMHLHYGGEGIEHSEWLQTLNKASKKAHDPIIKALRK